MTILTEGQYTAEHILSLPNGNRAVKEVTIASGQNLAAGAVVENDGAGEYIEAVDGNATDVAVLYAAVDASAAAVSGAVVHASDCEFKRAKVVYPAGFSDAQKDAMDLRLEEKGNKVVTK